MTNQTTDPTSKSADWLRLCEAVELPSSSFDRTNIETVKTARTNIDLYSVDDIRAIVITANVIAKYGADLLMQGQDNGFVATLEASRTLKIMALEIGRHKGLV